MGNSSSSSSRPLKRRSQDKYQFNPAVDFPSESGKISRRNSSRSMNSGSRDFRIAESLLAPTHAARYGETLLPVLIPQNNSAPPPYSGVEHCSSVLMPQPQHHADVDASSGSNIDYDHRVAYLQRPMRKQSEEDALEILKKYNTVFVVDDSASMVAYWKETEAMLSALAETAGQYDMNGIDIHFLNSTQVGQNMKSIQTVTRLFNTVQPRGITPIGDKLEELLHEYLREIEKVSDDWRRLKQIKPINYIVITDGAASDDPESVIVQAARRLDEKKFPLSQVGIQFVQIGTSAEATEFLEELDKALSEKHKIRDIVDTTSHCDTGGRLSRDMLIKILLGGINRRFDKGGESPTTKST